PPANGASDDRMATTKPASPSRRPVRAASWNTSPTGRSSRFAVAFYFGTGVRAGELRKADLRDLDTVAWRFRVMHPKGANRYGIVGAEVDIYAETRVHVADFLAARETRLKALDLNPAEVQALLPNEPGN